MIKVVAIVPLLAIASSARADPGDPDPDRALRLSVVGATAPIALVGVGLVIASRTTGNAQNVGLGLAAGGALVGVVTGSIGELYGHGSIATGLALRTGGVVVANVGLFLAYNSDVGDCTGSCHLQGRSLVIALAGAALYAGGMVLDIVDAPTAARSWHARHELKITPTAIDTGSKTTLGVGAAFRF